MEINSIPKNPKINDVIQIRGIDFIWDGYDWLYKETLSMYSKNFLEELEANKKGIEEQLILVDRLASSLLADHKVEVTTLQLLDALSTSKLKLDLYEDDRVRITALAFAKELDNVRKQKHSI